MLNKVIFIYFAAVIVMSAVLVVSRRNPIHSVLFMLLLFFHTAGVFVLLNAEFLAAVQIIVYAGAILVLYLFVVMLLNVDVERTAVRANRYWPWSVGLALFVTAEIALLVMHGTLQGESDKPLSLTTGVKGLGVELYTKYLVPFEVASIILIVGLVGAVVLAKKRSNE